MRRLLTIAVFVFVLGFVGQTVHAQGRANRCSLKGNVFIEPTRALAQYRVFVEESEDLAEVRVFKADNGLFADEPGKWHFVQRRGLADFTIFVETQRSLADFTIYYTETEAFAGCQ